MKFLKYSLILILSVFMTYSCTNEDLVPEPEPETAVHGFVATTATDPNFIYQNTGHTLPMSFQWVSVDGKNTVTKIEFFVQFTETYTDWEGGSKTANHGTVLFNTVDAPPANRTDMTFTIDQAMIYDLFKDNTYAYDLVDGDDTAIPVWGNTLKPNRDVTASPFVDGDAFKVTWKIYTADGRVFDTWNDSICLEFPGANCNFSWALICSQDWADPSGDFTLDFTDTYGDGWNGASIDFVEVTGTTEVTTNYTIASGASANYTHTVAATVDNVYFVFNSGAWDSEVIFVITSPNGNEVANWGPSPPVGRVTVNLCNE
jgi:hypothetical protein